MTIDIQHPVILYAQPTNMTCWSAAVTMLTGTNRSISSGQASTGKTGGLKSDENNVKAFAQSHGLNIHYPQSWTLEGLISLIKNGPFAVLGAMPRLHAIVVGGIVGDGTDQGTNLKIYDPWPPKSDKVPVGGQVKILKYDALVRQYPFYTMYILQ